MLYMQKSAASLLNAISALAMREERRTMALAMPTCEASSASFSGTARGENRLDLPVRRYVERE